MFKRSNARHLIIGITTALAGVSIACQPASPAEGPTSPTHLSPSEAVAVLVESQFPHATPAEEAYARALSNRFGPPAWTKERGPLRPLEGFRLEGGTLEITLLQHIDERGQPSIQLELHEPQGEPY